MEIPDMKIYLLDGKDMTSREKAYRVIENVLPMPEWFGHNLDALYDSLSEMDSDSAIVFVNLNDLRENLGPYADKMLACFRELADEDYFTFLCKD